MAGSRPFDRQLRGQRNWRW